MNLRTVDGLSPESILATAASALRGANGDRTEAERALRRVGGGRPYRGSYAQMSDELIPSFYHQAADVVALKPRLSNAQRWSR